MFPTVQQPEIKDGVSSDKEKAKLSNALRRAANMVSQTRVTATTKATGVFTAVWTSDEVPAGAVCAVEMFVVFRTTTNTPARGRFWKSALFFREPAGVLTQQGATGTVATDITSDAFFLAAFAVAGNTVTVTVLDNGTATTDWDVQITAREVT